MTAAVEPEPAGHTAGFRRSRPEATHTVTAEQAVAEFAKHGPDHPYGTVCECDAICTGWDDHDRHRILATLAALGVTVADTPEGS